MSHRGADPPQARPVGRRGASSSVARSQVHTIPADSRRQVGHGPVAWHGTERHIGRGSSADTSVLPRTLRRAVTLPVWGQARRCCGPTSAETTVCFTATWIRMSGRNGLATLAEYARPGSISGRAPVVCGRSLVYPYRRGRAGRRCSKDVKPSDGREVQEGRRPVTRKRRVDSGETTGLTGSDCPQRA